MPDINSCETSHLTPEQVAAAIITKTEGGDWALRGMLVEACADDALNCSNGHLSIDASFKNCIGISPDCDKPALRIGVTKKALATHLGLAYANNAAAVTALGGTGFQFYNTTTEAWAITA